MELIKLKDKIRYIKRALKTPYHLFYMTPNKLITVVFEDKSGKRHTFTGLSIFNSTETAEEYVRSEIAAGTLKEPKPLKNENQ